MLEDKLTAPQRIRLECLAQANAAAMRAPNMSTAKVIETATMFEDYVKGVRDQ